MFFLVIFLFLSLSTLLQNTMDCAMLGARSAYLKGCQIDPTAVRNVGMTGET